MQPQISPGVDSCGNLACTDGQSPYKASVEASMLLRDVLHNLEFVPEWLRKWWFSPLVVLLMLLLLCLVFRCGDCGCGSLLNVTTCVAASECQVKATYVRARVGRKSEPLAAKRG